MGHLGKLKDTYRKLWEKLDSYPIGLVQSEHIDRLLKMVFRPEEAELASRMPLEPCTPAVLSKRLKRPEKELQEQLADMANRGLLFRLDRNEQSYYLPMWSIPGFIEMTMMKVRDDIPQNEIAHLMQEIWKERNFAEEVFQGETQFGRALIDEPAAQDTAEVLPYERVHEVVQGAKKLAVAICYCRHEMEHLGQNCKYPSEVCMALNQGAEFVIQQKFGRQIDHAEALAIIEQTSSLGLMHIGDNVKKNLSFICNCCQCCCGILRAYHDHGLFNVAMATSFVMEVNPQDCIGCGQCVAKCQLKAIHLETKDNVRKAFINNELCLGCGICFRFCPKHALHLQPRPKKIITPEITMEKILIMAIERGKLQDMMFNDVHSWTHRFLRIITKPLLRTNWMRKFLLKENTRARIRRSMLKRLSKAEQSFILD